MKAHQATYPVRVMGRLLGVSASGFYAWKNRPLSRQALEDIALTAKIHAIHRRSGEAYGAPSIHAEFSRFLDLPLLFRASFQFGLEKLFRLRPIDPFLRVVLKHGLVRRARSRGN